LEFDATEHRKRQLEHSLLDQIVANTPFEVPPSFVDQIIDAMIKEMQFNDEKERQKAMFDEQLRLEFRDVAKRRAQNTLILSEIARSEKLEVSDHDVEEHVKAMYQQFSQALDDEKLKELAKMMAPRVKESILLDKAMNLVIDAADVQEIPAEQP
jgi:trigger factor